MREPKEDISGYMKRNAPELPTPEMIRITRVSEDHWRAHICEGSLLDRGNHVLATGDVLPEESPPGFLTLWIRVPDGQNLEPMPNACNLRMRKQDGDLSEHPLSKVTVGPAGPCPPHYLLELQQR